MMVLPIGTACPAGFALTTGLVRVRGLRQYSRKFPESACATKNLGGTWPPQPCPGRTIGWSFGRVSCRLSHPEMVGVSDGKTIESRPVPAKLAVLRKHPIFCDLDADAFEQLCRYAKPATLKRGATIVSKGDPGNSLIAVISGTVKISISSPDGRNAILNLIGPGEIFGEVAVLDGQARTADAIANSNCEIFVIDRREFLPFVRSQPALAMKFIELLCTRLRWTSDQVEEVILQG